MIEPNNEDQLFQKLIGIFNNPFSRGVKMHQYANDNFSSEIICDSFSKLYIKAIKNKIWHKLKNILMVL